MTVYTTKPAFNIREKLNEVDHKPGQAGLSAFKSDTKKELFNAVSAGRRNLLVNGNFDIWQRRTTFTGTSGYFGPDQWFSTGAASSFTASRVATNGSEPFRAKYYMRIVLGSDNTNLNQKIEHQGIFLADKPTVLSFWAKSNKPVTWRAKLHNDQGYILDESEAFAGLDWTYNEIKFMPASYGDWTQNGSEFIRLYLGREFSVGDATIDIAQVQYEIGSQATPFEYRPYGEELALCKRYYHRLSGDLGDQYAPINFWMESATAMKGAYEYPVEMRDTPTITVSGSWTIDGGTSGNPSVTLLNNHQATAGKSSVRFEFLGSFDARDGGVLAYTSGGVIEFDATIP